MIDIHSHVLHGLDDGPASLEQSLELARLAVQEGISTIIATPHHRKGSYCNPAQTVETAVSFLQEQLVRHQIPLTICSGQEIHTHPQWLDDFYANQLLTLNGSTYILIEFPSSKLPKRVEEILHELSIRNLTAVIAHPERNKEIAEQPDKLLKLIEHGALAQVTSHSITGYFGPQVRSVALELCRRNLVHFIASDAHDAIRRPFHLQRAYGIVTEMLGGDYVKYYQHNAESLLKDRSFEIWRPVRQVRRSFFFIQLPLFFRRNRSL
ncbi:tyrosine-protein phosphatase [Paenibacillus tyrfis]|uniref:tyrosine-protein phosphatase n=1 Tax=Paenibacillus tyrfis TaxID=1501230 RepID=UPI000B597904|nr:CpsB/CapC family capsule biosynthesis tyrosine phosphatase [Paenibacillus tyrfis]